jgi:hypothetical protein
MAILRPRSVRRSFAPEALDPAHQHVLADGGDKLGDHVRHRLAVGHGGVDQGVGVAVHSQRRRGHVASGLLEQVVAGDEIGLGVQFDGGGDHACALVLDGQSHEAFGGDAVGLFGGLGQALGAQPVGGRFDIAVRFLQRFLAVHHADAGLIAKFLHERSGDLRHGPSSDSK